MTPRTPKATEMPTPAQLGHLGLKSSPYAPTDCKLTSQHMIRDRMAAHYKKLNKARAAVDSGPPKAWLVSQKMRDRARREASKNDVKNSGGMRPLSSRAQSLGDLDRTDMIAMMGNLNFDETAGFDTRYMDRPNTSMELHASETTQNRPRDDMQFVNRIVNDTEMSPSRYTTGKPYRSNIPPTHSRSKSPALSSTRFVGQKPMYQTQLLQTYTPRGQQQQQQYMNGTDQQMYQDPYPVRTPRNGDVIEKHSEKFTEGKPFQPRTLKSNRSSKLSQFKYYNPPKRKDGEQNGYHEDGGFRPESGMSGKVSLRTSMRSRPGTANTDDMWNETIVSRDYNDRPTPTGVPALDISMDQDNIKWLQEQSHKAMLRGESARTDDRNSTRDMMNTTGGMNSTLGNTRTMNGTMDLHMGYSDRLNTTRELATEEEELQYLEFIQDVTSDVLDRGIFTNRMLKQVFETHVIRRRHILNEDKMREKLDDLRIELGIPEDSQDDYDSVGLSSTLSHSRASRRSRQEPKQLISTSTLQRKTLPNLHSRTPVKSPGSRDVKSPVSREGRSPSPGGKPPLPRPGSRGNRTLDQTTSSLGRSQDLNTTKDDSDSVFGTVTRTNTTSGTADILKVEHEDDPLGDTTGYDSTLRPDINGNDDEGGDTLLYQQHLQDSLDRSASEISDDTPRADDTDRPLHTERAEGDGYTDRTNTGHTDRTQEVGYTDRTETDKAESDHAGYTERTESHSPARSEYSGYESDRSGHSHHEIQPKDSSRSHDDHEVEVTDRSHADNNQQSSSARRRRREASDSARSHRTNTTTETIEVSELEEGEEDDDSF